MRSEITLFYSKSEIFIWRQAGLSRNAKDISNRRAELYDKLVGFIADLQRLGERIQQAQDSYIEAHKKFSEGSGNVIRQAEMLKQLGVTPSKAVPFEWVESSMEESLPHTRPSTPGSITLPTRDSAEKYPVG